MRFCLLLLSIFLTLSFPILAQTDFKARIAQTATAKGKSDAERLHALFALQQEIEEETDPEGNTWRGKNKHQDKWSDLSLTAIKSQQLMQVQFQQAFKNINRSKLSKQDQLSYDLFTRSLEQQVAGQAFPGHLLPISKTGGFQTSVPQLLAMTPLRTEADCRNYLLRLERLPVYIDQHIALMKEGLKQGIMPPRVTMEGVVEQVQALYSKEAEKSLLFAPLAQLPATVPAEAQREIRSTAAGTITGKVDPAVLRLRTFLEKTYLPKTRETIAFTALPNGAAWYNHAIKGHTTTNLTYQQIHERGQAEVKRIRAEMDKVIAATGFKGSFADFSTFLRTDPRFFYNTPEELLNAYSIICKKIDPELPRLFGKLPRLPYGVKETPANEAPTSTTAYYMSGSQEAGRPGYFYANTYNLKSRPKWEMEALSIHEAVPGHHLQIALAQELENVPEFRKRGHYTAYVEGWGLYSESLGTEMGFYQDPYSRYGQLTYEMWRAIRLVVDTGMHGLGWTRQQAVDFFKANSAKTEHDINVEIDRYIAWPGQALAYKVGELKIKELRARAEQQLGAAFDISQFHDTVLGSGAVPLDVLEQLVDEWIKEKKKG